MRRIAILMCLALAAPCAAGERIAAPGIHLPTSERQSQGLGPEDAAQQLLTALLPLHDSASGQTIRAPIRARPRGMNDTLKTAIFQWEDT